jgi:hypothetical protein
MRLAAPSVLAKDACRCKMALSAISECDQISFANFAAHVQQRFFAGPLTELADRALRRSDAPRVKPSGTAFNSWMLFQAVPLFGRRPRVCGGCGDFTRVAPDRMQWQAPCGTSRAHWFASTSPNTPQLRQKAGRAAAAQWMLSLRRPEGALAACRLRALDSNAGSFVEERGRHELEP